MKPVVPPAGDPLPWTDRAVLIAEILLTYTALRARRRDVANAAAHARRPAGAPGMAIHQSRRLAKLVARVLDPLPADTRCVNRSLVLLRMLARRGVRGEVVIGVRAPSDFAAHAWVEVDGKPLLPADDAGFERLVSY